MLLYRHQSGADGDSERKVLRETIAAIRECEPSIQIDSEAWLSPDPTDHKAIFEFLRSVIPKLRARFQGRELVIHISPGTPSMQTIWVLMGETGSIEPPLTLVKSCRPAKRRAGFQSPSLQLLFDEAGRIAHLKVPVLILGERGTGKTTLAAWIRMNSPYR